MAPDPRGVPVQEYVVPPLVPPRVEGTLADIVQGWADREPHRPLVSRQTDGVWRDVTAAEFSREVRALAKGFVAAGIQVGDRVGIMSRTRYEWTVADFALWTAGAVPVPIYETSSPHQATWIIQDTAAVAILVEAARHSQLIAGIREEVPALRDVWQIDGGGLDELVTAGADVSEDELDGRRADLNRSDLATIIYTSGTTGRPKGAELTHGNFLDLCENAEERFEAILHKEGASILLFLPLAHVFARLIEVLVLQAGMKLAHSPDVKQLMADLVSFQPTFLLAVPRVFEKVYNGAAQKAIDGGRGAIFLRAADVAQRWSRAQDTGGPSLLLKVQHALFDKLVYSKLRTAMGGRVEYAVSGGAALGERMGHFFRGIGLIVLEGYGLTETTAPITVNTPELIKIGTVGPPLPGVGVRISDGEVLVRGVNVFRGYHNNVEATEEGMADGWFRTGDLGELDVDGFLRITGRAKEILVTAGGKNVSPGPLEDQLRATPLISQALVVGEAKPFVAALITLDPEVLPGWLERHELTGLAFEELRANDLLRAAVQKAIDKANESVSRAETIRTFEILEHDFTEENGYLTPSLKLKRNLVTKDFAADIEGLYS
ncbi:AMP-dependent synthetase/ligase [Ornithinimicrobium cryptoxanthini]|uniref:Acyl-CoA synthetase n=1 Tax=Ornithinimicrobium cryptoxanthini TaxID=2934161 RepID=A0ABY4YLW4_9MICO|nr:AMP-dependent synthetase/ligase [Ornithinimicrobium cryptoxanthini]USQ77556.1 AMP-dependent synthetase/ligase [Ornithinimicrobium cryptoxanthini]